MRYAINLPTILDYANPCALVDLASAAEDAGWDAVFTWDSLLFDIGMRPPVTDPYIVLGAIAARTKRIKIGTMIAQLARRRPAKVAREIVTLDHLSNGRLILGVGLGFSGEAEFATFGEDGDARVRADKLDECLDIVAGLCSGEPFRYSGTYYQIKETTFLPRPIQARIPIWVAGYWPNKRPFRRAARWDGASPAEVEVSGDEFKILPTSPATARVIGDYIAAQRTIDTPFDMVISRALPEDEDAARALVAEYKAAGVSWIYRDMLPWEVPLAQAYEIIRKGPPRF